MQEGQKTGHSPVALLQASQALLHPVQLRTRPVIIQDAEGNSRKILKKINETFIHSLYSALSGFGSCTVLSPTYILHYVAKEIRDCLRFFTTTFPLCATGKLTNKQCMCKIYICRPSVVLYLTLQNAPFLAIQTYLIPWYT